MTNVHPLRRLTLLLALAAVAAPAAASAHAAVSVRVGAPAIAVPTALPPLVVVEPGVQVVRDIGEEIFLVDGSYWARNDGEWYRAGDRGFRWVHVEPRWVPGALVRIPAGSYRYWHPGRPYHPGYHPYPWRRPYPYGARRGEWEGAGWHGARPGEPPAGRPWTETRWSPPSRDRRGHH